MKKMTKTLLAVSGICGGAGAILLTVGVLMGARGDRFWDALSIQSRKIQNWTEKSDTSDSVSEDWDITVYTDIQSLEVDLGARELQLEEYNGGEVQVYVEKDDPCIQVKQEGQELKIHTKKSLNNAVMNEYVVKILVPENYKFDEVDVSVGAGTAYIENLRARSVEMETGAGGIVAEGYVQAKESSWDVAAGSISLASLQSESTEIDCAAGSFEAALEGKEEEYRIQGEIGAGDFTVGEDSMSAFGKTVLMGEDNARRNIKADCAAGSITLTFTKE